jgi:hypothetical protein
MQVREVGAVSGGLGVVAGVVKVLPLFRGSIPRRERRETRDARFVMALVLV